MPDSSYTRLSRLSAIIMILPSGMGVGWLVGYYAVDRNFGTFPWGSVAAILIGAGAGLYEIFQLLSAERGKGK
jgi:F0F1-type ATP synthase assembly protein I